VARARTPSKRRAPRLPGSACAARGSSHARPDVERSAHPGQRRSPRRWKPPRSAPGNAGPQLDGQRTRLRALQVGAPPQDGAPNTSTLSSPGSPASAEHLVRMAQGKRSARVDRPQLLGCNVADRSIIHRSVPRGRRRGEPGRRLGKRSLASRIRISPVHPASGTGSPA